MPQGHNNDFDSKKKSLPHASEDNELDSKDGSAKQSSENIWVEVAKTLGISAFIAFGIIRPFVAEARFIPSGSMLPTLQIDDRLLVDKISYRFSDPQRGDIIIFMPPDKSSICEGQKPKEAFIKRVIGLPGDKVAVTNGSVYINEERLDENYLNGAPDYPFGPVIIPDDQYFVLGDNRNQSCDSHYWGSVPRENIIGRAIVRFWPANRVGQISPQPSYQQ